METELEERDIIDSNNNKIGVLSLPINTSEDVWEEKLRNYKNIEIYKTPEEKAKNATKKAIKFGEDIVIEFASENILLNITESGKTKLVADYLSDVLRYLQSGSLYEVINKIDSLTSEEIPQELSPFITEERLLRFKNSISEFLQQ